MNASSFPAQEMADPERVAQETPGQRLQLAD